MCIRDRLMRSYMQEDEENCRRCKNEKNCLGLFTCICENNSGEITVGSVLNYIFHTVNTVFI